MPLLIPPALFDRDVRGELEVKMGEDMVIARRREEVWVYTDSITHIANSALGIHFNTDDAYLLSFTYLDYT